MSEITETALESINKQSTNSQKRQRRHEWYDYKRNREYRFQIQQIGRPIQSILLKSSEKKIPFPMEDLVYDGERTSSPGQLTLLLTENFRQWFQANPEEKGRDWKSLLEKEELFKQLAESRGIKDHDVINTLWRAIDKRPDTSKLKTFQDQVQKTPTEAEFMRQIEQASQDSAGGMTGLSYSMLKDLPIAAKIVMYKALVQAWDDKTTPESWKWRWIHPIPKQADPDLTQLRPICLLECLRKLWSRIFVQRIANFLQEQKVLHKGQFSGKGGGTDAAVMEFAAALETAKERSSEIFISS